MMPLTVTNTLPAAVTAAGRFELGEGPRPGELNTRSGTATLAYLISSVTQRNRHRPRGRRIQVCLEDAAFLLEASCAGEKCAYCGIERPPDFWGS